MVLPDFSPPASSTEELLALEHEESCQEKIMSLQMSLNGGHKQDRVGRI